MVDSFQIKGRHLEKPLFAAFEMVERFFDVGDNSLWKMRNNLPVPKIQETQVTVTSALFQPNLSEEPETSWLSPSPPVSR